MDERLPVAERKEFTPTPKQMLYGQRAELMRIVATEKDASGRVLAAMAEVELKESRGGDWSQALRLPGIQPDPGGRQTLHARSLPNDWYGYWCGQVVDGLCEGQPNRPLRPAG